MKKMILLAFMAVLSLGAFAQTAQQVLDKTAKVIGNKSGASANFSMSSPKYGSASGTIAIKGNKFNARTAQATVWYDGKTQWTYMKKTQEVNVSNPTEAQQQSLNPYKFIYIYKNGYTLSSKKVGSGWQVHLNAQNQKRTIKEMYVTVDKNYQLKQVKMRQANGWSTINVSNFRKANLSDSSFRFNSKEYPNAEVIDLR